MTFSLAGRCLETGRLGYVVATSSVCVGARVGAISRDCVVFSQARTDPRLHQIGIKGFDASGGNPDAALRAMRDAAVAPHWRQLGVLPRNGDPAHHTGSSCLDHCGAAVGKDALALGNFLGSATVLPAMIDAFTAANGDLAERLLAGIRAGEAAGSEREPLQSASLVVMGADELCDVDLRIDRSEDPIMEMGELLADWLPKAPAYRIRALDPDNAPSSAEVESR
ncbi:DUF1028 domain-containing protein [Roseovarius sp. SCSIO 43702]|uniref:DUF1028 domain-containing protein n=1 Tax=Roseovarius sp. SCSIO 43702 TaxID=2823043 RepID=UPI001C7330F7|nr:DUF1028 domain-containing protein [Roseovarius sp. SCSIO 43702]QYX56177.1 DUF1028 domain-containing protein [Roseovarius sp. SCSIO 43702]